MEKIMETIALFNNLSLSQDYYDKNMTENQTEFCTEKERKNLTNPKTMTNILTKIIIDNEKITNQNIYFAKITILCNGCIT